ncbi:MAG: IS1634 family transposase [Bacilli bacterium]|nr:IS1634 family transposase [Bacilli bacterium]
MRLNIRKKNNYSYYSIIKDYTNLDGKRTTKIFEKLGNQQQVEKRFGKANTIDNIKKYITDLNKEDKEELIKIELNPNKRIVGDNKINFNVGYLFLEKLYNELNIKSICDSIQDKYQFHFDLNEILSYLVYARIIYPSSKLETFNQCKNFIVKPSFELHDEYRALSYIAKNMDYIQEQIFINSKKIMKRNSKIIYYDCTNYFFEIDNQDDLRKYGISKEHRPNPLVGMGLFMDGDGLPLSFNIYPGNKNEQTTLIPEESKIINNFKLDDSKIILCTDAGLSSDEIKKFNIKDSRGFVITQSIKKLKDAYKKQIFDKSNWRIVNDLKNVYDLSTIENNTSLREKYYNTLFYKIIETETKSVKQDLIVTFSFKYFDYNRTIRNNQIERAKKSIESGNVKRKSKNQNDYRRFIDSLNVTDDGEVAENIEYCINEEIIKQEEIYDGYYGLTTNLVGEIEEILKIVKGRWEIEESFKIMKSDFLARPINLSREDRIKAHFMTCFISLLIYRILEKKLNYKYTTSQILDTLRNMNMLEQKGCGYQPLYERTQLTDELHEIFRFNTDYEIVSYKKMKKILNIKIKL